MPLSQKSKEQAKNLHVILSMVINLKRKFKCPNSDVGLVDVLACWVEVILQILIKLKKRGGLQLGIRAWRHQSLNQSAPPQKGCVLNSKLSKSRNSEDTDNKASVLCEWC
mmetsp:Transcript_10903/g.28411  ORF Transcript_10903/g.28411 Transcript_10903/m.28411 type:complete len:110 (+) Transcript_10903:296-625(+)